MAYDWLKGAADEYDVIVIGSGLGGLTGANTMRIQSVRGAASSEIFVGTTIPGGFAAATSETHRLIVNGYYVSRTSSFAVVPL